MNWFYYDQNNEKIGPIATKALKEQAAQGHITPETVVVNQNGRTIIAGKMSGLTFPETHPRSSVEPVQSSASASVPFATIQLTEDQSHETYKVASSFPFEAIPVQRSENIFPPVSTVPDMKEPNTLQLSRAVFIFLAVFVGVFGVHDFYAKRVREGRIHLALLLPWILAIFLSILGVFGMTLYALCYAPLRKDIRDCQQSIDEVKDKNKVLKEEIVKKRQDIIDAKEGRLRKQRQFEPQQQTQPQRQFEPQQQPQQQRQFEPLLQTQQQRQLEPQTQTQSPRVIDLRDIDEEFVQELEEEVLKLERQFIALETEKKNWEVELERLKVQQGAAKIPAWISVGPFWLYFFFVILPFLSWVMAMIEIVYVTKDGTGSVLSY